VKVSSPSQLLRAKLEAVFQRYLGEKHQMENELNRSAQTILMTEHKHRASDI
jgi:hypothetical protein